MAAEEDFIQQALDAGFDDDQAAFLFERLAQRPHTHTADEIITDEKAGETLDETLESIDDEIDALSEQPEEEEEEEAV